MPHLLSVWPNIARRVRDAEKTLVLFDFDGTLAPIAERPELAALSLRTRGLLTNLSQREEYIAGVISGRGLEDVTSRVDVAGMIFAGNHGFEMSGPGVSFVHPAAGQMRETQERALRDLKEALSGLPGVIIEDKGLTLSVHYRLTPEDLMAEVQRRFNDSVMPHVLSGRLRTTAGKMVLEVRPNLDWDKGKAVAMLQEMCPEAALTMFFGDDVTDEDGFVVVQEGNGIAVFVGAARLPTRALHRVDSPAEVTEALGLLVQL